MSVLNPRLLLGRLIKLGADGASCKGGNFSIMLALLLPVIALAAGGVLQYVTLLNDRAAIQAALDSGVLKAASLKTDAEQLEAVSKFMSGNWAQMVSHAAIEQTDLAVHKNADNSLTATFSGKYTPEFLQGFGFAAIDLTVRSSAIALAAPPATSTSNNCIMVMGNQGQALLVNSGAMVNSTTCGIYVNSVQDPAFIMNSGSALSTTEFCVRGKKYINNGGTITNPVYGCAAQTDPYAGKLPTPVVSSVCETSGPKDGSNFTLNPGVHCGTTFNGSPTITFAPGLHIIKGTMTINSGSTVTAKDATFYFPDTKSKIQFNGNVTFKASAPTTGTYSGILMFENTASSSNKTQLVFNGTKDFSLTGIIELPNRDVTFNSTSNMTSSLSMVVNTMILNDAKWNITPYTTGAGYPGSSGSSTSSATRLTQ